MMDRYQDFRWKLEAFRAAYREAIEDIGEIHLDRVFNRAKEIYYEAIERDYFELDQEGEERETPESEEPAIVHETAPVENAADTAFKQCPRCNDLVPNGWKIHKFKKNGEKCGHKWL